ncbi:sulfatase-like hydrolase/transferase [Tropicimonas aquimaris]|uniref:Sulfatase-like hydrolase/transferase n=1 Tax=Tropicimonas aquimaris TaxID=914152 RepID=A0ABW3ILV2_9RHOB
MPRPNILLITADQWRGDCLGAVGHPAVLTPNVDALAGDGTLFARHYAPCAPCSPARASLYTGLYQMNHRVIWNGAPLDDRFDNIARAARRAGYSPTLFGYTDTAPDPRHLAPRDPARQTYEGLLPGFELRQPLPEDDKPWISWLAARGRDVSDPENIHRVPPEPGERISMQPPRYDADETQTAFLTDAFLRWMGEQEGGAPWFAHVSLLRPHPPFAVPAPYNRLCDVDALPDPVRAGNPEAEPGITPCLTAVHHAQMLSGFVPGAEGLVRDLSPRDLLRLRGIYLGMIAEVDAQIGRLVAGLKAAKAYEATLIVFTSDHGEMLGDHWMMGKGGFHEQSYHIPLVLKVPGGKGGQRVEAFTSAVDVYPTLCETMGVRPDHAPDGETLLPFCEGGQPKAWRDAALWEYDFRHLADRPDQIADGLTPEDCVLVCRRDAETLYVHTPRRPPLLFDLASDPGCLNNVAERPEALATRLRCAEALLGERARLADRTLAQHLVWDHPASA